MLFSLFAFCQDTKVKGIITSEGIVVEGVQIINLSTEKETLSNNNGIFFIEAKEDDLLVFTSTEYDYWRHTISKTDIEKGVISIKLTKKPEALNEVVVNYYSKINAKDLGIINYTPRVYTPAERRLFTATSGGGILPLDPIINWITGRTKMLKKEIKIEEKERLLAYLDANFENEYYTGLLKINKDKIGAFKYYVVEEPRLSLAISKGYINVNFLLAELSVTFNQLQ